MAASQKLKRFNSYRTDRLSEIPTMASAISKKITNFKEQNRKLVDESVGFFESYMDERRQLHKFKKRMVTYNSHIKTIESYKKEHGKFPKIKGHESTERFLHSLYRNFDKDENASKKIKQKINSERAQRYQELDHLIDNMLDLLDSPKIFSQFLGTIALSTPLPDEKVRCVRNEKFKPIYIAALTVALFDQARCQNSFENEYIKSNIEDIFTDKTINLNMYHPDLSDDCKIKYREEILKPIAKASLMQYIGSYSQEAEDIFKGDRYRSLQIDERNQLIEVMANKSKDYIKFGIGIPQKRFDKKDERAEYLAYESLKNKFMLDVISSLEVNNNELGDLIRIPMVYASFIVSTKPEYEYEVIYDAFDIIKDGGSRGSYNQKYVDLFLKMVGRFPLGSGIFMIAKENNVIERAIVSSLYPQNVDEPICKQITKNQIQSLNQTEVIVSKHANIFFESSRHFSEYDDEHFQQKFDNDFTWNANELWEVQIPAITFWKKDGTIKNN